jgi:predicted ribosome quality control (RQC) complex YloA/Tae2 family protein
MLLDRENVIREVVRPFHGQIRVLDREKPYPSLPPPAGPRTGSRRNRFSLVGEAVWKEAPLSSVMDAYFLHLEKEEESHLLKQRILKGVARRARRKGALLARLKDQLKTAGEAEHFKKEGDLLQANFHRIEKGRERIEVEDLFDPARPVISISLDPAKGPADNIAQYYKRFRKGKNSRIHLSRKIEELEVSLRDLEACKEQVPLLTNEEELSRLASRLGLTEAMTPARRKTRQKEAGPAARKFWSSDGLLIFVGKDGASSDRLTFRFARGNDLWLHGHQAAGSHVIIRCERNKPVPLNSLKDAGLLAVHFSKLRGAARAEVIYTPKKYVRHLRDAAPGKVTVERFKTLQVLSDPDRLARLLDTARREEPPVNRRKV